MANSSPVAALDDILASQYNNLRLDVLDATSGHDHDGTEGKKVNANDLSGTTLASGVTASSLTSVGTMTALTLSGATISTSASTAMTHHVMETTTNTSGIRVWDITTGNPGIWKLRALSDDSSTANDAVTITKSGGGASSAPTVGAWLFYGTGFTFANALTVSGGGIKSSDSTSWFLNDSANANMTTGLTINQGAATNEILALKSSVVAPPMTNVTEADTFGRFGTVNLTAGGLSISGHTDADTTVADTPALWLRSEERRVGKEGR